MTSNTPILCDAGRRLSKSQRKRARLLGLTYLQYEVRLADRKAERALPRPVRVPTPEEIAEETTRAERRAAQDIERVHRAAEEARRAAERARQHEANLAERAAARAAEAEQARQRRQEAEYKRIQADELAALRERVNDGRKYDEHGITIQRSTGLPVVRTMHADGVSSYSACPTCGDEWTTHRCHVGAVRHR